MAAEHLNVANATEELNLYFIEFKLKSGNKVKYFCMKHSFVVLIGPHSTLTIASHKILLLYYSMVSGMCHF